MDELGICLHNRATGYFLWDRDLFVEFIEKFSQTAAYASWNRNRPPFVWWGSIPRFMDPSYLHWTLFELPRRLMVGFSFSKSQLDFGSRFLIGFFFHCIHHGLHTGLSLCSG